jgi:hydrogenase maturation protease
MIAILGLGNILLGDEGAGVHAVRALMSSDLSGRAEIVDGGTGGFRLLPFFRDYRRLIMIDAADDGRPPGTVTHLKPRFAADFPPALCAHDIGLKDLIQAASILGDWPEIDLITISIAGVQPLTLEVSDPVRAALPAVEKAVRSLL